MAKDVIIIVGSVYHLYRNPTCCIKPLIMCRLRLVIDCGKNKDLFFSLFLFFVHFCFNSLGPKPIAAIESIKSKICLPPLPTRSAKKLWRAKGWNKMSKLWNYNLREVSTSFGIHKGRCFNDLCVWRRDCVCLTMDVCNARSWPGAILSGQVLCSHILNSLWLMDEKNMTMCGEERECCVVNPSEKEIIWRWRLQWKLWWKKSFFHLFFQMFFFIFIFLALHW